MVAQKDYINEDPDRWVKALRAGEPKAVDAANRLLITMSTKEFVSPTGVRILQLFADGYTWRDIHQYTGIAKKTIESHRQRILWCLDASNTTHAVFLGIRQGLIQ